MSARTADVGETSRARRNAHTTVRSSTALHRIRKPISSEVSGYASTLQRRRYFTQARHELYQRCLPKAFVSLLYNKGVVVLKLAQQGMFDSFIGGQPG